MTCVTKTSGETRQKRYDTLTLLFFSVTLPRHALLRPVHDCLFFITGRQDDIINILFWNSEENGPWCCRYNNY